METSVRPWIAVIAGSPAPVRVDAVGAVSRPANDAPRANGRPSLDPGMTTDNLRHSFAQQFARTSTTFLHRFRT